MPFDSLFRSTCSSKAETAVTSEREADLVVKEINKGMDEDHIENNLLLIHVITR